VRLLAWTDQEWADYRTGAAGPARDDQPVMRTIQECQRSVLRKGTSARASLTQPLPPGLVTVELSDRPPSRLVVAWNRTRNGPLIRSFAQTAAAECKKA
jgi:hypothetical protein